MRSSPRKSLTVRLSAWLALAPLLGPTLAHAWSPKTPVQGVVVDLLDRKIVGGGIPGLMIDRTRFDFSAERTPGAYTLVRSRLHVYGSYKAGLGQGACVLTDPESHEKIALGPKGEIELTVLLTKGAGEARLSCITPGGSLVQERIALKFAQESQAISRIFPVVVPRWSGQVGLGATMIDYADSIDGIASDYKSVSTTLTGGVNFWIKPGRWLSGASGYITLLPITHSAQTDGATTASTVRFFGFNLRAGYVLPQVPKPWAVSVLGGYYYITTLVDTGDFGITNLSGPQLYPSIRYTLKRGDQIGFYFKFSPVAGRFSQLSLSSREMAAGVAYIFLKQGLSISTDFSKLDLLYAGDIPLELHSQTASLSVGKTF